MKKQVKFAVVLVVLAIAAAAAWFAVRRPAAENAESDGTQGYSRKSQIRDVGGRNGSREGGGSGDADADAVEGECSEGDEDAVEGVEAEEQSDEDKRADEEEALVDAFDDMTDKFMEIDDEKAISMDDVKKFHEQFKKVPKSRKEECLQRALNLVPDENIMLLAGILMDKDEDKELVELVFNDILNREDSMKQILLKEIFKDKTHPCWSDAAWILDVTKEGDSGESTGEMAVEDEGEERGE